MHEQAHCRDEAANHQLHIAVAFRIIWIVSMEECSSLTQNLTQIHCSTRSVIFNMTSTQYTCSLNGIYRPHWLVQWSCHCSCTCIPVHSPWLLGYIDFAQTILIILTMAGLFWTDFTCKKDTVVIYNFYNCINMKHTQKITNYKCKTYWIFRVTCPWNYSLDLKKWRILLAS